MRYRVGIAVVAVVAAPGFLAALIPDMAWWRPYTDLEALRGILDYQWPALVAGGLVAAAVWWPWQFRLAERAAASQISRSERRAEREAGRKEGRAEHQQAWDRIEARDRQATEREQQATERERQAQQQMEQAKQEQEAARQQAARAEAKVRQEKERRQKAQGAAARFKRKAAAGD